MAEILTARKLKAMYDARFAAVLHGYLQLLEDENEDRPRRAQAKYKVVKPLPSKEEYDRLRAEHYTVSIQDLISDANSQVEELAGEMRSWYDNLPENLQSGERGERVGEAADTLEGISQPDVPKQMEELAQKAEDEGDEQGIKTVYYPGTNVSSRADRAAEAAGMYRAAAEAVREFVEDAKVDDPEFDGGDLESFADECESAADELEGVEFPGMFG